MVRTLSVTVTVSPLVTGDPSTSIGTVLTGGLAALGVQFRVKGAPTINSVYWTGGVLAYSGGSGRWEQNKCSTVKDFGKTTSYEGSHCTSRVKLPAPLPASL